MPVDPTQPSRGHEQRDANAAWILGIVIFLFVFGLSIHGILAGFLRSLQHSAPPTDAWRPRPRPGHLEQARPPGPTLQVSPPADLQAFRSREEAELHSYGWVDRTSGVVRIPIDRAMQLVLQEGLPAREGTNPSQTGPSTYQLLQQRTEHREPEIKGER